MKHLFLYGLLPIIICTATCCSGKKAQSGAADNQSDTAAQTIVPDTFILPDVPKYITHPQARAEYLSLHYWDRFDVDDSKLIEKPEITEQAFADYINILSYLSQEKMNESLLYTLKKTECNPEMYLHFIALFEKYLYEANSPFHNETMYFPVLQEAVKSTLLSDAQKSTYQFQLDMALKNRVGEKAENFDYTLPSGKTHDLYSINSEYILLMFSNPECHTCKAIIHELDNMPSLHTRLSMNNPANNILTILTVYPDDDLAAWKSNLSELPTSWIHAYDKGMVITKKKTYDLKAIPSLYLLDKNKKVLLKDTSPAAIDDFFSTL